MRRQSSEPSTDLEDSLDEGRLSSLPLNLLRTLSGQKGTNPVAEKPESMFFGVNDNFQACQNMRKKSLFVIEMSPWQSSINFDN